jgi:hypothetical protein
MRSSPSNLFGDSFFWLVVVLTVSHLYFLLSLKHKGLWRPYPLNCSGQTRTQPTLLHFPPPPRASALVLRRHRRWPASLRSTTGRSSTSASWRQRGAARRPCLLNAVAPALERHRRCITRARPPWPPPRAPGESILAAMVMSLQRPLACSARRKALDGSCTAACRCPGRAQHG